jgi:hypothetical protein
MTMILPVMLTGNHSLDFTSEISFYHFPHLSLDSRGYINPKLGEEVDGPRPHSTSNHDIRLL